MGQVSITINSRTYRLACDDGEEDRLVDLATYVKSKVEQLTSEIGHAGDERLMLMAALMISDELWDARAGARGTQAGAEPEPVRRLRKMAGKMAAADHASNPAGAEASDDTTAPPSPAAKVRQ